MPDWPDRINTLTGLVLSGVVVSGSGKTSLLMTLMGMPGYEIKAGKILPSTLLKKLNNKSKKNRLFHAFRELGMVVRTIFLLQYIINMALREQITATANKVESFNGFIKWILFGSEGVITENDPIEQEKRIKYAEIVANAVILHNVVDMTNALKKLIADGHEISRNDIAALSPFITRNIKRFGDYPFDINTIPSSIQGEILSMLGV